MGSRLALDFEKPRMTTYGRVPPDQRGRGDGQFTRDPAIGNNAAG